MHSLLGSQLRDSTLICKFTVENEGVEAAVDIVFLRDDPELHIWEHRVLADGTSHQQLNLKTSNFGRGFINVMLDDERNPSVCRSKGLIRKLLPGPPDQDANVFHQWIFVAGLITKDEIPGDHIECTFIALQDIANIARDTVTFHAVDATPMPRPDLIVESLRVSEGTLTPEQSFTVHATVRNQGNATTGPTTLRTYREGTPRGQVGTGPVSGLLATEATQVAVDIVGPSAAGTYYYRACVDNVRNESDTRNNCSSSVAVIVTSDRGFTDDPIVPGVTPLRALHFTELRMRIDDLRVRHGLGRFRWTDPTLRAGLTPVRGVHMSELRTALDQVYDAVGQRGGFNAEAVEAGWEIHAWHINELRRSVEALER